MEMTIGEILNAVKGTLKQGNISDLVFSVSSDSRTIKENDFFVPLKGPNFDGHNYISEVQKKRAKGTFAEKGYTFTDLNKDFNVILVDDTLKALGDLAAYWRNKMNTKIAIISGSSGKTTTKNLIRDILSPLRKSLFTEKNFNNLIGVPHTLLNLTTEHQYAVLELGMNEKGELARLTEISSPQWGALLNIGTAHIGKFGSEAELIEAKAEMVKNLNLNAVIIYNADCEKSQFVINKYGNGRNFFTFGINNPADVSAFNIDSWDNKVGFNFKINLFGKIADTNINVFGKYNIYNALCAASVLSCLGLSIDEIAEGIKRFNSSDMRSQILDINGIKFVLDCYNSNPTSLIASAESFCDLSIDGNRFLVAADMLELGNEEEKFHREVGQRLSELSFKKVFLLGERAKTIHQTLIKNNKDAEWFSTHEEAANRIGKILKAGDAILFKGSRLMKLEKVFENLKETLLSFGSFNIN